MHEQHGVWLEEYCVGYIWRKDGSILVLIFNKFCFLHFVLCLQVLSDARGNFGVVNIKKHLSPDPIWWEFDFITIFSLNSRQKGTNDKHALGIVIRQIIFSLDKNHETFLVMCEFQNSLFEVLVQCSKDETENLLHW